MQFTPNKTTNEKNKTQSRGSNEDDWKTKNDENLPFRSLNNNKLTFNRLGVSV